MLIIKENIQLLTKYGLIYISIPINENDEYAPLIDEDFTVNDALEKIKEIEDKLQPENFLKECYPNPNYNVIKTAIKLFKISHNNDITDHEKKRKKRELLN